MRLPDGPFVRISHAVGWNHQEDNYQEDAPYFIILTLTTYQQRKREIKIGTFLGQFEKLSNKKFIYIVFKQNERCSTRIFYGICHFKSALNKG